MRMQGYCHSNFCSSVLGFLMNIHAFLYENLVIESMRSAFAFAAVSFSHTDNLLYPPLYLLTSNFWLFIGQWQVWVSLHTPRTRCISLLGGVCQFSINILQQIGGSVWISGQFLLNIEVVCTCRRQHLLVNVWRASYILCRKEIGFLTPIWCNCLVCSWLNIHAWSVMVQHYISFQTVCRTKCHSDSSF